MPTGLNAATLARIRANAQAMMTGTCTIQQIGKVSDGAGGFKKAYTTVATNVPCLIGMTPRQQSDSSLGMNTTEGFYTASFPYNAAIADGCQILHNGNTYEVWAVENDQDPAVYRYARLIKVNTPT